MTLTVAAVQQQVMLLVGRLMNLVGIYDGVPQAGSPLASQYVNAALRDGLERMGYYIADQSGLSVVDSDVAVLNPRALRRLMEWTELYLLDQVMRDWWRTDLYRPPELALRSQMFGDKTVIIDPLDGVKSRIASRIEQLNKIVKTPYQSMNTPISVGLITIGSRFDPTIPLGLSEILPPWTGAPDGLWCYGVTAGCFWGWGEGGWECGGWG